MKIAFLADIHANLQALEACLADAQQQGATRLAFLGDLVGYGGQPAEVVDRVVDLVAQGAWAVKGNHDAYAVDSSDVEGRIVGGMGVAWTRAQLQPARLAFLNHLPLTLQHGKLLLLHASAHTPASWSYVDNEVAAERSMQAAQSSYPEVRYVFGGHVHRQALYYAGSAGRFMPFKPVPGVAIPVSAHRSWVATVGSVGQPRDGRTEAMYAMFEQVPKGTSEVAHITFHRVAYNHMQAAQHIRQSGMPQWFAQRLLLGR